MIITILCGFPNSPYARDILRELNGRGLRQVHVVSASPPGSPRTLSHLWATHGLRLPVVVVCWITNKVFQQLRVASSSTPPSVSLESEVLAQGGTFVCVPDVNGSECQRILEDMGVDIIILGGAPIVRAHILRVPQIGTLNAHQGELPRFRGMNVIEWALVERCPPTITVHFVDPGVDTGDIVAMEKIPVKAGDSLKIVRESSVHLQSQLLAKTAAAALDGLLPRQTQRREDGKQYYSMHPTLKAVAEQRLQEYIRELFPAQSDLMVGTPQTHPSPKARLWRTLRADIARFNDEETDLRAAIRGMLSQGFLAIFVHRIFRWFYERGIPAQPFRFMAERVIEMTTGISIPVQAKIGKGLRIHHFGGIMVHPETVIGEECTLYHQVTLGDRGGRGGAPRIGNRVMIGVGAKVLGNVEIGDDAVVGANAVVLTAVPSKSIAVGVPAIVKPKRT